MLSFILAPLLASVVITFVDSILQAIVLGIIEGITEFLPVSSTGHLLIAEYWLGARSPLFNVAIQIGAILAVMVVYRERLRVLLLARRERDARDYVLKLGLAFGVTAVLGFAVKKLGATLPEAVHPVAWALVIGGFAIFAVEAWIQRRPINDALTWRVALLVGLAQVLAGVFPGTSRSAAAIFAALLGGLTHRPRAAEFAFLVGIPTMFAAAGYELLKTLQQPQAVQESWLELGIAGAVSAVVGFISVKWLLRYISTHSFTPFAWYRIALGGLLLLTLG